MTPSKRPGRQGGFALVLALGAAAVVLALAAALDAWVGARVEQARLIRERLQDELDAYSTRATVLYLLGTQRTTRAGLAIGVPDETVQGATFDELQIEPIGNEILLDGTAYQGIGRIRFALQDQAGLVAVNGESQTWLRQTLEAAESDGGVIEALLDALDDYRDNNTTRRINGAEREEYAAADLDPPADAALRSAPEILQVFGWREWLARHPEFRLHDWLATVRVENFDPNRVPASLLRHWLGADPRRGERFLAERAREPFRSLPDFIARADLEMPLEEDRVRFFPSDALQLRLWREGAAQGEMLALQLTPLGRLGPWQIDSSYRITLDEHGEAHDVPGDYFGPGAAAAR